MKYTLSFIFLISIFGYNLHVEAKSPKWTVFSDLKVVRVITNQEENVAVGDWACTIGKIVTDKFGNESRRFGCSVDGGPQVFLNPVCSYSKQHRRFIGSDSGFSLQMKHQSAMFVSLECNDRL